MVYLNIMFSIGKIAQYNLYGVATKVKNHQISSKEVMIDDVESYRY